MGVKCKKRVGRMERIMKKLDNELLKKAQEEKEKIEKKEGKSGKETRKA